MPEHLTKPLLVFVHGGQHTGRCWQPTIDAIQRRAPEIKTLAVDLPGHGDEPGDLATLTIADCVASVLARIEAQIDTQIDRTIEATATQQVILVGHSMAGITLPGVAAKLGAARIRHMVYVACCIPPQGKRVIDTLHLPMNVVAGLAAKFSKVAKPLPRWLASWVFVNGATAAQKEFTYSCLCNESPKVTLEPVDRSAYPNVPATWVLPLRDRAVNPSLQRQFMRNLGRVDEVIELDTCHNAMVTEPEAVAEAILKHC